MGQSHLVADAGDFGGDEEHGDDEGGADGREGEDADAGNGVKIGEEQDGQAGTEDEVRLENGAAGAAHGDSEGVVDAALAAVFLAETLDDVDGVVDGEADADGEDEDGGRDEVVSVEGKEGEGHGEGQEVWENGDKSGPERTETDEENGKDDEEGGEEGGEEVCHEVVEPEGGIVADAGESIGDGGVLECLIGDVAEVGDGLFGDLESVVGDAQRDAHVVSLFGDEIEVLCGL